MRHDPDLRGKRFGKLVGKIQLIGTGKTRWVLHCDCGEAVIVAATNLLQGHTKSCGCLKKESPNPAYKHGMAMHGKSRTKIYNIWAGIKARIANPNCKEYRLYGARGITMHPEWKESFTKFYEYMGDPPEGRSSIDRINNDGNYEPGNVRWASMKEQNNNRRNNFFITAFGKTLTASQWGSERGISPQTILARIQKLGWSQEDAVSQPASWMKKDQRGTSRC